MDITNVVVNKFTRREKGICGVASVTINDVIRVHDIKIISGINGLYIVFPNTGTVKVVDGKKRYQDACHTIRSEDRTKLQERIIQEYEKLE